MIFIKIKFDRKHLKLTVKHKHFFDQTQLYSRIVYHSVKNQNVQVLIELKINFNIKLRFIHY
jgi:hypothetical protein